MCDVTIDKTPLPSRPSSRLGVGLGFGMAVLLSGCSDDPVKLVPATDRAAIQKETDFNNRLEKKTTVEDILANARGERDVGGPRPSGGGSPGDFVQNSLAAATAGTLRPLILHLAETNGILDIPPNELAGLEQAALQPRSVTLTVGPSNEPTPLASAVTANRRSRLLAQRLPPGLRITSTRYDKSLAPNTARLEFGAAESAH